MAAAFSIQAQADYIRVEITGSREAGRYVQDMVAGWSRVAEECRARNCTRILAINRLSGAPSTTDAFEIAAAIPPMFRGIAVRLANVVVGDAESWAANQFAEDVTVNRGFNGRSFGEEGAALAWLLAAPGPADRGTG
jgi:hypothetical protein